MSGTTHNKSDSSLISTGLTAASLLSLDELGTTSKFGDFQTDYTTYMNATGLYNAAVTTVIGEQLK